MNRRPSDSHSRLVPSGSSGGISSDRTSSQNSARCRARYRNRTYDSERAQAFRVAAQLGTQHQAADLGQALVVVADAQDPVREVQVQRLAVALFVQHVEEDVRRAARAVLGEDHRRPQHRAVRAVGRHEHEATVGQRQLLRERGARSLDDGRQRGAVVGKVDRIQVHGGPLEVVEVAGGDVAEQEHGRGERPRGQRRWRWTDPAASATSAPTSCGRPPAARSRRGMMAR